MSDFSPPKKIPLGKSDFDDLKTRHFAYADKTRFIEILENLDAKHVLFTRPPRFGKTLTASMLAVYYDIAEADRFDSLFGDTYIGRNKTALANQFYVLKLEFSGLANLSEVEKSFTENLRCQLRTFFDRYPHPHQNEILSDDLTDSASLLERFFCSLGPDFTRRLYVIIDDYDQVENTFCPSPKNGFNFLKAFWSVLKEACGHPVSRIFVTGNTLTLPTQEVLPSFVSDYSDAVDLHDFMGFTEADLRHLMIETLNPANTSLTADGIISDFATQFGNYRFCPYADVSPLLNARLCLNCLDALQHGEAVDAALNEGQDLKLEAILKRSNPIMVKEVVSALLLCHTVAFPIARPAFIHLAADVQLDREALLSALFFFGYLTYADNDAYTLAFPNSHIRTQFEAYAKRCLE